MKILVMGLPGSGKTTLAKQLVNHFDAFWLNADVVRKQYNDWDFSREGRIRQADRMKKLADQASDLGKIVVADFICPTNQTRIQFDADYVIWMDTIEAGRYDDTNQLFENPEIYNYRVSSWYDDNLSNIITSIENTL